MSTVADNAHANDPHAHGNAAHLAHHFDTPSQQYTTGKLGMWTFLATEVLMFGGLFCAYAVYRYNHPQVYLWAHHALDATMGMINTIVLLASSFTMAWGVRAAQMNQRGLLKLMLVLTFIGGVVFMCVKAVEYQAKWKHFLFPGEFNSLNAAFIPPEGKSVDQVRGQTIGYVESHIGGHGAAHTTTDTEHGDTGAGDGHSGTAAVPHGTAEHPETLEKAVVPELAPIGHVAVAPNMGSEAAGIEPPTLFASGTNANADTHGGHHTTTYGELEPLDQKQLQTFFSIYFMMTGLHGIHVLVGMGLIAWLYFRAAAGQFTSQYFAPVDLVGLYWHLVDLIWIFLFPLLYLIH